MPVDDSVRPQKDPLRQLDASPVGVQHNSMLKLAPDTNRDGSSRKSSYTAAIAYDAVAAHLGTSQASQMRPKT